MREICQCNGCRSDDSQRYAGFYAKHFVPNGWRLLYDNLGGEKFKRTLFLTGICDVCQGDLNTYVQIESNLAGGDLLTHIYDQMEQFRPYDRHDETYGYFGECKNRSRWYARQDQRSVFQRNREFLSLFHYADRLEVRQWLTDNKPFDDSLQVLRLSPKELFRAAVQRARDAGDMARMEPILEYVLPDDQEPGPSERETMVTEYQFDFLPMLDFGCEGIYLNCFLRAKFDDSSSYMVDAGTIKTLRTDLDACKLMGELAGVLLHHASEYVGQNLHLFTTDRELKIEAERKKKTEADHGGAV